MQPVWTGALLGGTGLLASYPWLRSEPLDAALALAGLAPGWRSGAVVLLVFAALALSSLSAGGERLSAAAAVFLALFLHLPHSGQPLLAPEMGVTLDSSHPAWAADLGSPRPVGGVVLESSLSGGAGLAGGTPIAMVRLRDDGGRSVLWVLRAGEGTGEWAARRPDVEHTARLKSPPAWISWVAGDFFGQRYRAAWTLRAAQPFSHLGVELVPGLPHNTGLVVHQVEVRR